MNRFLAVPLLLLAPATVCQDPADVLARFRIDGRPTVVTRADTALEMAFHLRRRERGREATDLLVDAELTRRAAQRAGCMPTPQEVEPYWRALQEQLRAAGHSPADFPAIRNTGREQWLADLAVQVAQERLVRNELRLGAEEEVSPDMLKLWLQEERRRVGVVTDQDELPAGAAAKVGETQIPLIDLGLLLLRTSEDHERDKYVQQVIRLQLVEALGRRHDVELTAADLDAAIATRRAEIAREPRYGGMSYEQLLQTEGMTIAALRELRVFRAQVLLDKVAAKLFPAGELLAELQRDRQHVLDLVGPRRHLGTILVRALEEPNGLVPRDFAAAERHLQEVTRRLDEETFANVAAIESEDPRTKGAGGDAGWHRRRSGELPDALLAAAFALAPGEVSAPVRTEEGVWLVKVFAVDPPPTDEQLVARLRQYKSLELSQQLVREAEIEYGSGDAAGTAEAPR